MLSTTLDALNLKVRGVIRLTRWKEYVPFVIPVTAFGAILAVQHRAAPLDWRLTVTILANILAVAYAFMINDIEDAPDDARESARAARNPIASGELTPFQGWAASGLVALASFVLYALAGVWPLIIGSLTLVLSHLYSWKPIRLKAWPVTDVVSHSLMLSGLLFLAGYFAYDTAPGLAWLVALAVTTFSSYGQLYNQIRDFEMDTMAGLHNTAILIGKTNARRLMYFAVVVSFGLLLYTLLVGLIPLWILIVPLVLGPALYFMRTSTDFRGTEAAEASGNVQIHGLILANAIMGVWMLAIILGLVR